MHYVSYLLDLTEAKVIAGTVAHEPDPAVPANSFAWKVVCDTDGNVVVRGMVENRLVPVATARWLAGELAVRAQRDDAAPNDHQWALVETTLREQLAQLAGTAEPREPILEDYIELPARPDAITSERANEIGARLADRRAEKPVAPEWSSRNRSKKLQERIGMAVGGTVLLAFVSFIAWAQIRDCRRSPEVKETERLAKETAAKPAIDAAVEQPLTIDQRVAAAPSLPDALALAKPISTTLVARYAVAKLRFAEVDAAETTLALVEKDHKAELGKRMCASGEIRRIERADMDNRKVFVGELLTPEQDRVTFLAVGSTGELVKRNTARFCGVVTDKLQLVGMFDLPENRAPAVEQ